MNPSDPVIHPLSDVLDLHTFRPDEVASLLDDYLEAADAEGYRRVLIIHGKGRGILKRRVRLVLSRHRLVRAMRDADAAHGGWGATVVELIGPESEGVGRQPTRQNEPQKGRQAFLRGLITGVLLALLLLWIFRTR